MPTEQSYDLRYRYGQVARQLIEYALEDQPTAYLQQLLRLVQEGAETSSTAPTIDVLPNLTCAACNGHPDAAVLVSAVWYLVRMGAKLLDDVEDGEIQEQAAEMINAAIGLLVAAQFALGGRVQHAIGTEPANQLRQSLNQAILRACVGQHDDLRAGRTDQPAIDPQTWLAIGYAKSGELLAWAAGAGALVAGADPYIIKCYRTYGYHLGALLQAADDFNDVWCSTRSNDLVTRRLTLPICYAQWVATAQEQAQLDTLLAHASQGDTVAEHEARQLLTHLGAQVYLFAVAQAQRRQALAALQDVGAPSSATHDLYALVDSVLPILTTLESHQ